MSDLNKVLLVGRLGTDPVQRRTKTGVPVVHFSLATHYKYMSEDESTGTDRLNEETQWHRIVVWGKKGEACARYLKKGRTVLVEGMIRARKYDGKQGETRMAFEIHADHVGFLGGKRESSSAQGVMSEDEVSLEMTETIPTSTTLN